MDNLLYLFLAVIIGMALFIVHLLNKITRLHDYDNIRAAELRKQIELNKDLKEKLDNCNIILQMNQQLMTACAEKHVSDMSAKDKEINDLKSKQGLSYCH